MSHLDAVFQILTTGWTESDFATVTGGLIPSATLAGIVDDCEQTGFNFSSVLDMFEGWCREQLTNKGT